jgi:hypothetical protein
MLIQIAEFARTRLPSLAAAALVLGLGALPAGAQGIESVDPDAAIDGDLAQPAAAAGTTYAAPEPDTR